MILCVNTGSSSLRIAGYRPAGDSLERLFFAEPAIDAWREAVPRGFSAQRAVHRIVRGLKTGVPAEPLTAAVEAEIRAASALAPTHDPKALELVNEVRAAFPQAAVYAAYDTAFHATIPPAHCTYAIPKEWRDLGIRRIGYHGLSCAYAAFWLQAHGAPKRAVHAHLGNGCSVTALRDGKSVYTSMGFTPLDGLVMGTRSGSVDPGALLYLQTRGMAAPQLGEALYAQSGLRALCGTNDMREVERRRAAGDRDAGLAFDVFVAAASRAIAAAATAAGGIDALTLAGGIGCNSVPVRESIIAALAWLGAGSRFPVQAIDVEEERMMAQAALAL